MLRTSISRPLFVRQFASSSSRCIPTRSAPDQSEGENAPKDVSSVPPPAGYHLSSSTSSDSLGDPAPQPSSPNASEEPSKPPVTLGPYDLELVKQRIRKWTEKAGVTFRNRADDFTATTKYTFSKLGAELNKVTGYEEIEALKRKVVEQESRIKATREAARHAKTAYEHAVVQRSNSQREVNELLQRKSIWTDEDVGRFTRLVRQDHLYEQEEARSKVAVDETEDAVDREFSELMRSILARYHEEQVWSDKIRSASTYGSLAALGLNLFVFVLAIIVVEPWKRRRLAQTFEQKIEDLSKENATRVDASMNEIERQLREQEGLMMKLLIDVSQKVDTIPEQIPERTRETIEIPIKKTVIEEVVHPEIWPRRREIELAAVGVCAFAIGVVGSILSGR
ncbi:Mdm33 family-domain-containing protein [Cyathus striatus]|nr:Mdm33 family-domain-containing protein [Cyathus striatus]